MESKKLDKQCAKIYELAMSYSAAGKIDLAITLLQDVILETDETELQARCHLRLGQLAEQQRQYLAALDHYEHGLTLRPSEKFTAYFLANNAGYCLIMLRRYKEAEALCRKAIATDASKYHNAWKNLGMSLEGQGELLGAAWAYVEATRLAPQDARAYVNLQRLIAENIELRSRFPGILSDKAACLEAITAAFQGRTINTVTREIARLKHVPGSGYLEEKDGLAEPISIEGILQNYTITVLKRLDDHPNVWISVVVEDNRHPNDQKSASKVNAVSPDDLVPIVLFSRPAAARLTYKPNCRRCRNPLQREKAVAGISTRWVCKTPGCPKGVAAFPKTSPWT